MSPEKLAELIFNAHDAGHVVVIAPADLNSTNTLLEIAKLIAGLPLDGRRKVVLFSFAPDDGPVVKSDGHIH